MFSVCDKVALLVWSMHVYGLAGILDWRRMLRCSYVNGHYANTWLAMPDSRHCNPCNRLPRLDLCKYMVLIYRIVVFLLPLLSRFSILNTLCNSM